jgi:hypothetical protein
MKQTAVEFIFNAVYRDIPFSELLGIIAQAKIMEKQQDKNKYSEEDLERAFTEGFNSRYRMEDGVESRHKFMEL